MRVNKDRLYSRASGITKEIGQPKSITVGNSPKLQPQQKPQPQGKPDIPGESRLAVLATG
jgi:hypothetical protein